jgi:hypothetical protein
MKKRMWVFVAMALMLCCGKVSADPYSGADVNIIPKNYDSISGIYAGGTSQVGWLFEGNAIYTLWQDNWVEYVVNVPAGQWRIGLNALNTQGTLGPDPNWYPLFEVKVQVVDVGEGMLYIGASDSIEQYGHYSFNLAGGYYRIRYTWLNDKYDSAHGWDSDFKITGVFLDRTGDYTPPPVEEEDDDGGGGGGGCFINTMIK